MFKRPRHRRERTEYLPATKLAAMGHCETKILLERKYGERTTTYQEKARVEGRVEHARFDQVVKAAHNNRPVPPAPIARDRRCFIASAVYGESDLRTEELRQFRDEVLARVVMGRMFIATYYATSPWVARCINRYEWLKPVVGWILDRVRRGLKFIR